MRMPKVTETTKLGSRAVDSGDQFVLPIGASGLSFCDKSGCTVQKKCPMAAMLVEIN